MKDPIALLSAPWLAERFGMAVVLTVRHPAGFAGSLRRLDWRFRFETFLDDERLMRERLEPFAAELREQVRSPGDFVEQVALLWRILYAQVDAYRREHPEWAVVRHEDLARDPLGGFEALYRSLGLPFTGDVAASIRTHSAPPARVRHPSAHEVRMDSAATVGSWRQRLSPDELERLRAAVRDVSDRFYDDDEW